MKSILLGLALSFAAVGGAAAQQLVAIDVVIEPDAALMSNANVVNAQLRADYPEGYTLDGTHAPHITLAQAYVRIEDVPTIGAALIKAVPPTTLPAQMRVTGLTTAVWNDVGVASYVIERSEELQKFENSVIKIVRRYAVGSGSEQAFVKAPNERITADTVRWVRDFVPMASGNNFAPHINLGAAHPDFVAKLKTAPFNSFTFGADAISIYQLGNYGVAQRKLWSSADAQPPE